MPEESCPDRMSKMEPAKVHTSYLHSPLTPIAGISINDSHQVAVVGQLCYCPIIEDCYIELAATRRKTATEILNLDDDLNFLLAEK